MVAILSNDGKLSQPPGRVRSSAYGVPIAGGSGGGLPAGDSDANSGGGSIVSTPDITQMNGWISGPYDVRGDLDLDGDVDNDDMNVLVGNFGLGLGWNKLAVASDSSLSGVLGGHRKGYCGYEHDWVNNSIAHVRNRAYFAELGRWSRRDPLGYVDGGNLYGYTRGMVLTVLDPSGLVRIRYDDAGQPVIDMPFMCIAGLAGCMTRVPGSIDEDGGGPPRPLSGCAPDDGSGDCCDKSKAGCSRGSWGGVICCRGRKVSCAWGPSGDTPADDIARGCVKEHEDTHHGDVPSCAGCPPGEICRPPFTDPSMQLPEECEGYRTEAACLRRRRSECPDQACRDTIDHYISDRCQRAVANCGRFPPECPSPIR